MAQAGTSRTFGNASPALERLDESIPSLVFQIMLHESVMRVVVDDLDPECARGDIPPQLGHFPLTGKAVEESPCRHAADTLAPPPAKHEEFGNVADRCRLTETGMTALEGKSGQLTFRQDDVGHPSLVIALRGPVLREARIGESPVIPDRRARERTQVMKVEVKHVSKRWRVVPLGETELNRLRVCGLRQARSGHDPAPFVQGLTISMPSPVKSRSLRVTIVKP